MSDNCNMPDRRSNDAQLGYLNGKVEALDARFSQHIEHEERFQGLITHKLEAIENQLNMYKHFTFFIRTIAVCVGALIAFNWQEAKQAWLQFWIYPHQ